MAVPLNISQPTNQPSSRYRNLIIVMRPSSLGGGRILRRTLSVCLSVRPSRYCLFFFTVEPSYERTSKIEKLRFSLMSQRHVCTFRHALRAAYRTAISAAQILVLLLVVVVLVVVRYFLRLFLNACMCSIIFNSSGSLLQLHRAPTNMYIVIIFQSNSVEH